MPSLTCSNEDLIQDITHLREKIPTLRQSKEKSLLFDMIWRDSYELMLIGRVIFDANHIPVDLLFLDANKAFNCKWGVSMEDIIGKTILEIYPYCEFKWIKRCGQVIQTGHPARFELCHPELKEWYDLQFLPFHGDKLLVIAHDITKEKQSQECLEVKQMELERYLKTQNDVFANISHELKTPLNVIFSTTQLLELYLRNNTFSSNSNKVYKGISTIKQNCYRFTKLINNIIEMSKIDSGYYKLSLRNENIVDVIENIVQSIAEYIRGKGLNIVFDTDIEEKTIACDSIKLERIMLNLISNAIKFSNPGGTIDVKITDRKGFVEISVHDYGIGIDEKYQDFIFERFKQVEGSLSRNAEGSGIGLSLVKSFVELHGGRIAVESEAGKGSIFKFELPSILVQNPKEPEHDRTEINRVETINIEFSDIYNI